MGSTRKKVNQPKQKNSKKEMVTDIATINVPVVIPNQKPEPQELDPIILAEIRNEITENNVFKMNHEGKTAFECIGITEEDYIRLQTNTRLTLSGKEIRSERVEKLVNICINNPKQLAIIFWNLTT